MKVKGRESRDKCRVESLSGLRAQASNDDYDDWYHRPDATSALFCSAFPITQRTPLLATELHLPTTSNPYTPVNPSNT